LEKGGLNFFRQIF